MLTRDPAVGAAYLADPLVYNGPIKRPTLQAVFDQVDKIAQGFELRCRGRVARIVP